LDALAEGLTPPGNRDYRRMPGDGNASPPMPTVDGDNDERRQGRASWHISDKNIRLIKSLGKGAFGEVWEGLLLPDIRVAVKVLRSGAVDADGDRYVSHKHTRKYIPSA
jgi:hypothetical protein